MNGRPRAYLPHHPVQQFKHTRSQAHRHFRKRQTVPVRKGLGFLESNRARLHIRFIAHKHAHKLTLQEQLVSDIANHVKVILGTDDVAVMAKGEHLCMTMRGIKTPHKMISSALSGRFHKAEQRAEFLRLVD